MFGSRTATFTEEFVSVSAGAAPADKSKPPSNAKEATMKFSRKRIIFLLFNAEKRIAQQIEFPQGLSSAYRLSSPSPH